MPTIYSWPLATPSITPAPSTAVGVTPRGHFTSGQWYTAVTTVIGPTMPFGPLEAPFMAPAVGGSTATIDQVRAIKRQILKWKSPHAYPWRVILCFPGAVLGGVNAIAPFTPGIDAPWSAWDLGKLQIDNVSVPPWIPGGFEV